MTIVEFLKQDDEACILNLRKEDRWMYWQDKIGWVVRQKVSEHNNITLITTENEEEAVSALMKGIKSE